MNYNGTIETLLAQFKRNQDMMRNGHFVPSKEGRGLTTREAIHSLQPQKMEEENSRILNDLLAAPTQDHLPLGNCLSHFTENWKCITDDKFVLNVIKEGYRLSFKNTLL
jgi:hypothetical protein